MAEDRIDLDRLQDLLDRHGGDLDRWPDSAAAVARRLVLADPAARALLDEARRLDMALGAREEAIWAFAAQSGLADRTLGRIAPQLAPRRGEARLWAARLAACFLIAAALGGGVDRMIENGLAEREVVMLDTVLYGPDGLDIR